jgi:ubiquinone/menaquinone biosynthesis C-methylase UbiE
LQKEKYNGKIIADLGCGEALLAQTFSKIEENKKTIFSFDLVKYNDFIIKCDISNIPLKDNDVDICIFCLSLMGSNFIEFINEARRILKSG